MSDQREEDTARASQPEATEARETTRAGTRRPADSSGRRAARRTRISGIWTAVALAVIVLLLLLIFILQNLQPVAVTYFGATGQLPLGVALLLGAVGGALLVIVVGVARILQLRHLAWRQQRQERKQQRQEEEAAHNDG